MSDTENNKKVTKEVFWHEVIRRIRNERKRSKLVDPIRRRIWTRYGSWAPMTAPSSPSPPLTLRHTVKFY